jgi:hypothetical protein
MTPERSVPRTTAGRALLHDLYNGYVAEGYPESARKYVLAIEAEAALPAAPALHQPGDHHDYRTECSVCGQRGMVTLSLEPQRYEAALPAAPGGRLNIMLLDRALSAVLNDYLDNHPLPVRPANDPQWQTLADEVAAEYARLLGEK